jgi:hypothetical protein
MNRPTWLWRVERFMRSPWFDLVVFCCLVGVMLAGAAWLS